MRAHSRRRNRLGDWVVIGGVVGALVAVVVGVVLLQSQSEEDPGHDTARSSQARTAAARDPQARQTLWSPCLGRLLSEVQASVAKPLRRSCGRGSLGAYSAQRRTHAGGVSNPVVKFGQGT